MEFCAVWLSAAAHAVEARERDGQPQAPSPDLSRGAAYGSPPWRAQACPRHAGTDGDPAKVRTNAGRSTWCTTTLLDSRRFRASLARCLHARTPGARRGFAAVGCPRHAFAESFIRWLRDECVNENLSRGLRHALEIIEAWRHDHNHERPHTSLNGLTPIEFPTMPKRHEPRTKLTYE
jgi:hypothetical protein